MSDSEPRVSVREPLAHVEFRGIILAQVASEAGDQIARVAIALLVLSQTGSALLSAATFAVSFIPTFLGAALLGPLADRLSRRNLMLGADLGRAIVIGAMALLALPATPVWLLFALLIVAEFFTSIGGLGGIIINSANNFDTATMFVPVIVIVLLAVGLTWLIGFIERRIAPWQAEIAGRNE